MLLSYKNIISSLRKEEPEAIKYKTLATDLKVTNKTKDTAKKAKDHETLESDTYYDLKVTKEAKNTDNINLLADFIQEKAFNILTSTISH